MLYLCRQLHFTEESYPRKPTEYIHCSECKKNLHKSDTLKFQIDKKTGMYYLRRASKRIQKSKRFIQDRRIYKKAWYDKQKKVLTIGQ